MSDETVREGGAAEATVREAGGDTTVRESRADVPMHEGAAPAAVTTRETGAAAPTTREISPVATIHEGIVPGTTVREPYPSAPYAASEAIPINRPRVNLPAEVATRYEWVRDLDVASGESDVSLIRDRETEELRFFKRYHQGVFPDDDVLAKLQRDSDLRHCVRIFDYSPDPNDAWEIHEYCPLGSLGKGEWASAHSYPYDEDTIVQIVRETGEAIHNMHELGIVHRDIKPSNILIRSDEPLDLVLTDFGVSRGDQEVTHRTTFAGTNLYAAPEAHRGDSSQKSDWFALGAIVYLLLTNKQLLAGRGDVEPSPKNVEVNCISCAYYDNAKSIQSERWQMLVEGLVVYDRNYRWGYPEVSRWLAGESPEVYWTRSSGGYAGISPEKCYQPSWSEELLATPDQLAGSIGKHWFEVKRAFAGRERDNIKNFLSGFSGAEHALRIIDGEGSIDRKLFELQLLLDKSCTPLFEGFPLDTETMRGRIQAAQDGDEKALAWLESLVKCDALLLYGEHREDALTAAAGRKLKNWFDQAQEVKGQVPEDVQNVADEAFRAALPELFTLAYEQKQKQKQKRKR